MFVFVILGLLLCTADAVSPVLLVVHSVSSGSESCNVTVTCRTASFSINSTFTCDNQTCNQEGGKHSGNTSTGSSLDFFLSDVSTIICNHSNEINWTKDAKEIWHLCSLSSDEGGLSEGFSACQLKTVWLSVSLIVMTAFVISVNLLERIKKQE